MEGSVVQWKEQSICVTLSKSLNLSDPQTIKMEPVYHMRLRGLKERMLQCLQYGGGSQHPFIQSFCHSERSHWHLL